MSDLTEFLLARIAEDQAVAQDALDNETDDDGRWQRSPYSRDSAKVEGVGILVYDEGGHTKEQAEHIARHDPARVLAECEAKRWIVALVDDADSPDIHVDAWVLAIAAARHLAAVYADHPDYREEWKV